MDYRFDQDNFHPNPPRVPVRGLVRSTIDVALAIAAFTCMVDVAEAIMAGQPLHAAVHTLLVMFILVLGTL